MDKVSRPKCPHCLVWGGDPETGRLVIGCAHCKWRPIKHTIRATTSPEEFARKVELSQSGHHRVCDWEERRQRQLDQSS
jgi:hypothetical protein